MKNFRNVIFVTIILFISAGMVMAGGGQGSGAQPASGVKVSPPGQLPIVTQDVTLEIGLRQSANITDLANNFFTKYIRDKTGISITHRVFASNANDSNTQLELMISSNEKLPDIIIWNTPNWQTYGDDGIFINLAPYFAKDAYFVDKMIAKFRLPDDKDLLRISCTTPGGKRVGFPYYQDDRSQSFSSMNFINTKWLDNLNLKMPSTTDEFYQTLIAFRDRDPNKNGLKDELPFLGTLAGGGEALIFLINSFVYHPFMGLNNDYLNVTNGKIWAPWVTEEYRDALRYISKLYKEGLIMPSTFTVTPNEIAVIVSIKEGEPEVVGSFSGSVATVFIPDTPALFDYRIQQPLIGPKGVNFYPLRGNSIRPNAFITKDCAIPEVAFRFLDFCWDPDTAMISTYGEPNVDWQWLEPGFFGNMGDPATFERINLIGAMNHNKTWGSSPAMFWIDKVNNWSKFIDDETWRSYRFKPYGQMGDLYEGKDVPEKISLIVYNRDENNLIRDMRTSIQSYREECLSLFSTGQMDIERDWNTYLSNLDRMGLKTYLDTAQKAYTRTIGK